MDMNQIIIAIYSYILHQDARLEADYKNASKMLEGRRVMSSQILRYWIAKLKYENFREFSRAISEILDYYNP